MNLLIFKRVFTVKYLMHNFKIAGTNYENRNGESRTALLRKCSRGQRVFFERDPQNKFDPNAILITNEMGNDLGFVPKEVAATLAFKIDCGSDYLAILNEPNSYSVSFEEIKESRLIDNRWYQLVLALMQTGMVHDQTVHRSTDDQEKILIDLELVTTQSRLLMFVKVPDGSLRTCSICFSLDQNLFFSIGDFNKTCFKISFDEFTTYPDQILNHVIDYIQHGTIPAEPVDQLTVLMTGHKKDSSHKLFNKFLVHLYKGEQADFNEVKDAPAVYMNLEFPEHELFQEMNPKVLPINPIEKYFYKFLMEDLFLGPYEVTPAEKLAGAIYTFEIFKYVVEHKKLVQLDENFFYSQVVIEETEDLRKEVIVAIGLDLYNKLANPNLNAIEAICVGGIDYFDRLFPDLYRELFEMAFPLDENAA